VNSTPPVCLDYVPIAMPTAMQRELPSQQLCANVARRSTTETTSVVRTEAAVLLQHYYNL
jgi:hypothetical protein